MVKHIVLLKMKPDISLVKTEEMYKNILQLKNLIPGIVSISGGKNNSPEHKDKDYTEGFEVEFVDKNTRDIYLNHQEHKEAAETYILPIIDDVIVFDFEC